MQEERESGSEEHPEYVMMPLLNTAFEPGHCMEEVRQIKDVRQREIALGEYYYFSGQPGEASREMEPYLAETDTALRLSAYFVYAFANLANDRVDCAQRALAEVERMMAGFRSSEDLSLKAMSAFVAQTASILLHLPSEDSFGTAPAGSTAKSVPAGSAAGTAPAGNASKSAPAGSAAGTAPAGNSAKSVPTENAAGSTSPEEISGIPDMLKFLPPGLRTFGCYVEAHAFYLQEDYSRSIGIADTALALQLKRYPIPTIYLHLVEAMDYMGLRRHEDAKRQLLKAWEIAQPDNLIEPFAEHHGLLAGTIEATLKKEWPEDFKRIIGLTYRFSRGWRKIHNPASGDDVADNLTTTEFAVAMLAARGWTNQEISAHMDISSHTVNAHIRSVLRKLNITRRSELKQYMLR